MKSNKVSNKIWREALESGLVKDEDSIDDYILTDYRGFDMAADITGLADLASLADGLKDIIDANMVDGKCDIKIDLDDEIHRRLDQIGVNPKNRDNPISVYGGIKRVLDAVDVNIYQAELLARAM